jgi:hypothetical protein
VRGDNMAIKKIRMRPPGHTDIVHPETDSTMVKMGSGKTLEVELEDLAGDLTGHQAESAIHKTSDVIRTETETKLKVEVVSSSVSETPDAGRIIFDTSQGKFFGGNGTEWV